VRILGCNSPRKMTRHEVGDKALASVLKMILETVLKLHFQYPFWLNSWGKPHDPSISILLAILKVLGI
jgi:hypothetical protein